MKRPNMTRKLVTVSAIIGFDCDLCGRIFALKRTLNVHKKSHLNKPRYDCEICCRQFASKCAVNEHMIRHKPDKIRYRCDQPNCNRKFYHKWRYDTHKKLQHFKKAGDFRCNFCKRSLASAFSLKRHILKCTAYKCEVENHHSI